MIDLRNNLVGGRSALRLGVRASIQRPRVLTSNESPLLTDMEFRASASS